MKKRTDVWSPEVDTITAGIMANLSAIQCDGCGQIASPDHVTRRLQRLEWATRYRPVHIHTLLLGAFSPKEERDFLYSPEGEFQGEAALLLDAVGISSAGKTREAVHVEFQRAGFFLTYLLECPLNDDSQGKPQGESALLLVQRLPVVAARIRRSLKPRRVMPVTTALEPVVHHVLGMQLGCPVVLDDGKPFGLDSAPRERAVARLREALGAPASN